MYDGSSYHGWQIQPNEVSVAQIVMDALSLINKEPTKIHASGRTDAKVHALKQVFHFDSKLNLSEDVWLKALNNTLPEDIRIFSVERVDDDFHARYNAKQKIYQYKINTNDYDVFNARYVYQYNKPLDIKVLKEACLVFIGTHNFTSYNATPLSVVEDQVRTFFRFDVKEEEGLVTFELEGTGFLRHMVRMLVASVLKVHEQKITIEDLQDALNKPDKTKLTFNVPGCGLYLVDVKY